MKPRINDYNATLSHMGINEVSVGAGLSLNHLTALKILHCAICFVSKHLVLGDNALKVHYLAFI